MCFNFRIYILIVCTVIMASCSPQTFYLTPESQQFSQTNQYSRQADLLFVMEASGAMDSQHRYQAVVDQIPNLTQTLDENKIDFNVAVTSMTTKFSDPVSHKTLGDGGNFIHKHDNYPGVLSSSKQNMNQALATRLSFQSDDFVSPINFGRLAVKNALSEPLISHENQGFLRDHALLNIIFISSKEDDVNNESPLDLVKFLDQLRPPLASGERSWLAHYVGVTSNSPNDQCASGTWNYRSAGLKFMDVVSASGGSATSICNADLTQAVANVKARILEVVTEYHLASAPDIKTIKVYVNSVLVNQDQMNGWTYESNIQAVRFHGTAIPADGSKIFVDYTPAGIK